jgi:UDP-N-acetylmuramoyl-L-alanyl-D-glutamate--2,6-diaminopimelate ligase
MHLQTLLESLPIDVSITPREVDPRVAALTSDSREVTPGALFVAVPGLQVDGHDFIPQALEAGAVGVVGERPRLDLGLPADFPYVHVDNARAALGWLHAAWHDFPSRRLTLVGVTGTDGKTTTTNLIHAMLSQAGQPVGMVSTVNARIGERASDTGLHVTTPPAADIQRYLAEMVDAGMTHAVLESTSHGLAQHRLTGCDFDVAVITNITHEHLDYHGSMEAYRAAKGRLFVGLASSHRKADQPKISVLNADDALSYDYLRGIGVEEQISYSLSDAQADVVATDIAYAPDGIHFMLESAWGEVSVHTTLVGAYNVSNILAAAATALALGVSLSTIAEAVADFEGVPGRMERIDAGQDFTAIVDFAHTPNALSRALEAARPLTGPEGRVIVVFGCAGLRDREKRQLMGEVAATGADLTVVTAEDPRTEPLEEIMAATAHTLIEGGRHEGVDFWQIPDRGAAIRHAVELARPGDVVLACGKGHEQSMCFGATEYPWDDREAMRRALRGETLATLPTAQEGQ